jgi:hypothetical protein
MAGWGAVIISSVQERSGSDSSMTSESGCKVAARQLRFSDEYGLARLSIGRFFVPDADCQKDAERCAVHIHYSDRSARMDTTKRGN